MWPIPPVGRGSSRLTRAGSWWAGLGMGLQRRLPVAAVLVVWFLGGAVLSAVAALVLGVL